MGRGRKQIRYKANAAISEGGFAFPQVTEYYHMAIVQQMSF